MDLKDSENLEEDLMAEQAVDAMIPLHYKYYKRMKEKVDTEEEALRLTDSFIKSMGQAMSPGNSEE